MSGLVLVKDPAGGTAILTRSDAPAVKVSDAQRSQLVVGGFRGVPGPPGLPGSAGAAVSTLPIGAVVQSLRLVRSQNGTIYPVDTAQPDDGAAVIGLALQSVTTIGNTVDVQRAGQVTNSSWAWSPGVVWCGPDGTLTQNPSATGWLMQAGRVITATTIDIELEQPIYRS